MNKLKEMKLHFPQTEVWNDSCSCAELSYAVENGASGATTNPVIVGNVLKKELPQWIETIQKCIQQNPTFSEDEVAWELIKELGKKASSILLPQFETSHGQKGRLSYQTNAKFYRDANKMVEQGIQLAKVIKNSQIKVPASKAGIEAVEELTYRGISINATVSFTCAQAIAVAKAVQRGLERREQEGLDSSWMHPVCTIMAGRVDDYLKSWVKKSNCLISAEALELAGVAVVKNAYQCYEQRGYRTTLLVAAFRNQHHWTQFIGGKIILTITHDWQQKYNESDVQLCSQIDKPIDDNIMKELLKLEEFKKAYDEDGLAPEQFEHYGAFLATMNQFLQGYDELIVLIRRYMMV